MRYEWVVATLAVVGTLMLTTFPLAGFFVSPESWVIGDRALETIDHLWTLWLASAAPYSSGVLVIETQMVHFNEGYQWVLADPINLLWFAPATWMAGPATGYNTVLVCNLLLAGAAAALLTRRLFPAAPPWVAACSVIATPALAAGLFTGMTETMTTGWAGLAVAAFTHLGSGTRKAAASGLLLGACAWAGPYTALYATVAVVPLVVFHLIRHPKRWADAVCALLVASMVAAPVLWAVLTQRPDDLPGSVSILNQVLENPHRPENQMLGADLLGLFWPINAAGGAELHAVYLGAAFTLLACCGWFGGRQSQSEWQRPLMCSGGLLLVMALGYFLQFNGDPVTIAGRTILLPAAWISMMIDAVGRAPRWYRAVGLSCILLAPFVANGVHLIAQRILPKYSSWVSLAITAVVVSDTIWLAPLQWPRDAFPAEAPPGYEQLDTSGAILEVPSVRLTMQVKGRTVVQSGGGARMPNGPMRHAALLWQTSHERPLGGNPHHAERRRTDIKASLLADEIMTAAHKNKPERLPRIFAKLQKQGFSYVVHHPSDLRPNETQSLRTALGPPTIDTPEVLAWSLSPVTEN